MVDVFIPLLHLYHNHRHRHFVHLRTLCHIYSLLKRWSVRESRHFLFCPRLNLHIIEGPDSKYYITFGSAEFNFVLASQYCI